MPDQPATPVQYDVLDGDQPSMQELRERAATWRCEITKNLCGTDTRPLNKPCHCPACQSWAQVMVQGKRPYWTQEMLDQCKREGDELFKKINGILS